MLTRTRVPKLCHGCRTDFLRAFGIQFSSPVTRYSYRSRPFPTQTIYRGTIRSLTQSTSTRIQNGENHTKQPFEISDLTKEKVLQMTLDLEEVLGQPIDESIEPERLVAAMEVIAARQNTSTNLNESPAPEQEDQFIIEATDSPLEQYRASGVTSEDVAREARNIFGESLPDGILNGQELTIYKRLYGEPVPEVDEEFVDAVDDLEANQQLNPELLDQQGDIINVNTDVDQYKSQAHLPTGDIGFGDKKKLESLPIDPPRSRAMDIAHSLGGELIGDHSTSGDFEDNNSYEERSHPLTALGKFNTYPRTVYLPRESFVEPVEKIMSNYSNKHLKELCERTFGGPGLPDSPLTPRSGQLRAQVPIPLEASQHSMGEMEANAFITTIMPPTYAAIMSVLSETRKRLGPTWLNNLLAKEGGPRVLDVSGGGVGILAWRDVVKAHWESLHSSDRESPLPPPSRNIVLTGSEALRHRAAALLENTTFIPRLPDYVHSRHTPTLEDDRPAQPRKQFDVIIAPHSLFGLKEDWMKKQQVQNLWSLLTSEGGVLILVEKGVPRGFEAIAGARDLLLERYIETPEGQQTYYSSRSDADSIYQKLPSMIVAPCTNHERCPMYKVPGLSRGRKDFCSFQQRYVRPAHLQRVLGAKDRNHDDVDFSYISILKGDDLRQRHITNWNNIEDGLSAPKDLNLSSSQNNLEEWMDTCQKGFGEVTPNSNIVDGKPSSNEDTRSTFPAPWTLPRAVFPPMKRKGHVTLDLCTAAGKIERWTVPKSFSKQAYRDARKSRWGDLWALGAKTRVARNLRLGSADSEESPGGKSRGSKSKRQAAALAEKMAEEELADLDEQRELEEALNDNLGDEDWDSNDNVLNEWEAEYEGDLKASKGKKGGAFAKFGKSSKEARKEQKLAQRRAIEAANETMNGRSV